MPGKTGAAGNAEVLSLGTRFLPENVDFVYALSSNEKAVASKDVVYDAKLKTITWTAVASALAGENSTVTIVVTQGNNVVYRQFNAKVNAGSNPIVFVPAPTATVAPWMTTAPGGGAVTTTPGGGAVTTTPGGGETDQNSGEDKDDSSSTVIVVVVVRKHEHVT